MAGLKDRLRTERIRHFLVALVVSVVLGVTGLLAPIDWVVWVSHMRIPERQASGEIVYIGADRDLTDPAHPNSRLELARLIGRLDAAGADKIFLDVIIQRPSLPSADEALADAIERSGRTYLVERFRTTAAGPRMMSSIPEIARSAPHVVAREWVEPFGYIWFAELGFWEIGKFRQSFAAGLAEIGSRDDRPFRIDYAIDYRSVPSLSLEDALHALSANRTELFAQRRVVIGNGGTGADIVAPVPGDLGAPGSMVAILAAETLRIGPALDPGWIPSLVVCALIVAAALVVRSSNSRKLGYAAAVASIPLWYTLSLELR